MIGSRPTFGWPDVTGIAALFVAATFLAYPMLDLNISSLFGGFHGFPQSQSSFWNGVRNTMIGLTDGTMTVAAALLVAGFIWPACRIFHPRVLAFAITSYALGPGLLVNGILKSYSGRARPRNIDVFGGDAVFSPVLTYADQCQGNCSFVSGEASALAAVATVLILVAVPLLPRRNHLMATLCILSVAIFGSFLRVAFGAHFPSDVIFAWLFVVPLVLVLRVAFGIDRLKTPLIAKTESRLKTLQERNPDVRRFSS